MPRYLKWIYYTINGAQLLCVSSDRNTLYDINGIINERNKWRHLCDHFNKCDEFLMDYLVIK